MFEIKIISFCTKGYYQQIAESYLIPSCKRYNVPYEVDVVASQKTWSANTNIKPLYIRDKVKQNKDKNVVFIDCDARFKRYPELFHNIPDEYDMACHFLDRNRWYNRGVPGEEMELLSGVLLVRNKPIVLDMMNCWVKLVQAQPEIWEQKHLAEAVKRFPVKIFSLPIEYCYIYSLPSGLPPNVKVNNPVIVQYQKSRDVRRKGIKI